MSSPQGLPRPERARPSNPAGPHRLGFFLSSIFAWDGNVPDPDGFVPAPGGQTMAVGSNGQTQNFPSMLENSSPLTRRRVPKYNLPRLIPVSIPTGQDFAIGKESDRPNIALMSFEGSALFFARHVPEHHSSITNAGREGLAIG